MKFKPCRFHFVVQGCRSDNECANSEACINGKCASPCRCGFNAVCDVLNHRASCKCLPGYTGNPQLGCDAPANPCSPNPCGINALCENDNGNPICFCPKGLTGNPFKTCSKYWRVVIKCILLVLIYQLSMFFPYELY